ncbi:flagellar hook-length control protein FliK [Halarcobacter ebronensis]|uniref:Flagellar hook-length control protein FliK n=1 Tax=Halarcobacter ebronensis TaxID=1462615 RepID=A0A4Q1AT48_9BACT|nr:flagellar hook-length control protein FliK [Halarcobacter ebronensis]RXK07701.1 flagellar hook-length control protein FliK [Halarcobacter ebronensis]
MPNNNNVLKEALKNADMKTLEEVAKGATSVGDILQNLFDDLKTGTKNNSNLENILKNSNLFKDFGSFAKSINTLLEQLDPSMEKYRPQLENFLKNISELDGNMLKEMINKSGVFLESKILEQTKADANQALPKNLENLLNQIKTILKDIPSLEAKNITSMIDKILQNSSNPTQTSNMLNSELKALTSELQKLSNGLSDKQLSNLNQLTNILKNISNSGQLVESKIENLNQNTQLAQTTQQTQNQLQQTSIPQSQQQITSSQTPIPQNLLLEKQDLINKTVDTLFQLRNEIQSNSTISNKEPIMKLIDNLLQNNDIFSKNSSQMEVKSALNQLTQLGDLKLLSNQNPAVATLVDSLKNQIDSISNLETKVLQNVNIQSDKQSLTRDIQQTLFSLKSELINIPSSNTSFINQIIDKLLNIQNLFSKIDMPLELQTLQTQNSTNSFPNNFANNLNSLILNLKESIVNLSSNHENLNLQNSIYKSIDKLETIVNNFIHHQTNTTPAQTNLHNDIKSVLLQMQMELQTKSDSTSNETMKQIDKIVSQIEYHQLYSIVSNSNSVYIPFLWDMLEDGNISMKKIDENKFYCEINLSLKEFGQTQLLLALYDKNKLDLTVYLSKESFKQTFRENSVKLKQALNKVNLIPVNIKIIDMQEEKEETSKVKKQTDVYNQNSSLNMGIDIRA